MKTETITRKDKLLVIGIWIALVFSIRMLLRLVLPDWIGGLGGIAIGFVLVYAILKMKRFEWLRARFGKVMRYWYTRKLRIIFVVVAISSASMLFMLEYINATMPEELDKVAAESQYAIDLELVRHAMWIFFAEDVEFYIFFALVKKGILFRE